MVNIGEHEHRCHIGCDPKECPDGGTCSCTLECCVPGPCDERLVPHTERPDGWPVLVKALRDAATGIEVAAEQTGNETVYFPPRVKGEQQPVKLRGRIALKDVAGLVRYVADMLEP